MQSSCKVAIRRAGQFPLCGVSFHYQSVLEPGRSTFQRARSLPAGFLRTECVSDIALVEDRAYARTMSRSLVPVFGQMSIGQSACSAFAAGSVPFAQRGGIGIVIAIIFILIGTFVFVALAKTSVDRGREFLRGILYISFNFALIWGV